MTDAATTIALGARLLEQLADAATMRAPTAPRLEVHLDAQRVRRVERIFLARQRPPRTGPKIPRVLSSVAILAAARRAACDVYSSHPGQVTDSFLNGLYMSRLIHS